MFKRVLVVVGLILAGSVGYVVAQQKARVAINADIAHFTVNGSSVAGTADKRLTFVTMQYNDVSVPCIMLDGAPSKYVTGGSSLSCGWTPEAIEAINKAGAK